MEQDAWDGPDEGEDPGPGQDAPGDDQAGDEGHGGEGHGGEGHDHDAPGDGEQDDVEQDAGEQDARRDASDAPPPVPVLRELTSERALVEHARALGRDPRMVELDDAALESLVRDGAAEVAALTCRWLSHLAELVVRGVWAEQGARTPGAWLSWAIGMGASTAREHVRVALRLRECPLLRGRFAAGTLSYSKVRALTRVATPDTEPMLLRWADAAPAATIERIVRDARRVQRAGSAVAERDDLGLHGRWRDDGSYELVVRVGATDGIALEQHVERLVELEQRDRDRGDGSSGPPDDHDDGADPTADARVPRPVLAADALLEALARAAAEDQGDGTTLSATRHDVVVHASTAAWASVTRAGDAGIPAEGPDAVSGDAGSANSAGPTPAGVPGTVSGSASAEALDQAATSETGAEDADEEDCADGAEEHCGASVDTGVGSPARRARTVRDGRGRPRMLRTTQLALAGCTARTWLLVDADGQHGGTPADLGRTRRDPDARLRRLLAARDVSCRFPGCGARRNLHAHHVTWWSRGGATDLDNLVLVCRAHHRAVHDDGWELRSAGTGRWTFHRPTASGHDATPLPWARPLPGASAEALAEVVRLHANDLAPGALRPPDHDGSGYDHGLAVELLVAGLAEAA